MDKGAWKKKIRAACESAGTYRPFFNSVIDTLAGIMALRDDAQKRYEESGGSTVVEHTNSHGATNVSKNPALMVLMDCNAQALQYWSSLGLTPKAYKAMTGGIEARDDKTLESVLTSIGI